MGLRWIYAMAPVSSCQKKQSRNSELSPGDADGDLFPRKGLKLNFCLLLVSYSKLNIFGKTGPIYINSALFWGLFADSYFSN